MENTSIMGVVWLVFALLIIAKERKNLGPSSAWIHTAIICSAVWLAA